MENKQRQSKPNQIPIETLKKIPKQQIEKINKIPIKEIIQHAEANKNKSRRETRIKPSTIEPHQARATLYIRQRSAFYDQPRPALIARFVVYYEYDMELVFLKLF